MSFYTRQQKEKGRSLQAHLRKAHGQQAALDWKSIKRGDTHDDIPVFHFFFLL
jgi:hypothetical protein